MIEDRIKRIEIITARAYKLAKLVRRKYNRSMKSINKNYETLSEDITRNAESITELVNNIRELMGTESEKKENLDKNNIDFKTLYL